MEYKVKIKGLDRFRKALSKYPSIAGRYFATAIDKSTSKLEGNVKEEVPVDTGLLRATTFSAHSPVEGKVFPTQNYAIYVHEGTRYQKAQPYLVRGFDNTQEYIQREFETALTKTLDEVARRT